MNPTTSDHKTAPDEPVKPSVGDRVKAAVMFLLDHLATTHSDPAVAKQAEAHHEAVSAAGLAAVPGVVAISQPSFPHGYSGLPTPAEFKAAVEAKRAKGQAEE